MPELRATEFTEESREFSGWQATVITYEIGGRWFCHIHNVNPGARVASGRGETREAAQTEAIGTASRRFARTRRKMMAG